GRLLTGEASAAEGVELGKVTLQLSPTGQVSIEPTGAGWRLLTAMIWIEVYLAQQNGTWQRLKVCRNPICGSTFFDRSKNNSGVWHDVKVCGNAANLRASRARKRLAATAHNTGQEDPAAVVV
ncbi:MAG: CGNR zinc finger domain-containing protein, partial [Nakamurella sp.]